MISDATQLSMRSTRIRQQNTITKTYRYLLKKVSKNFFKIQTLPREKPHDFDFGKLERYFKRHTDADSHEIKAAIKHLNIIKRGKDEEITKDKVIEYLEISDRFRCKVTGQKLIAKERKTVDVSNIRNVKCEKVQDPEAMRVEINDEGIFLNGDECIAVEAMCKLKNY